MDCWSFNPYQLFGSINQKQMMKKKNIKIKMFTLDLLSSHQNFDGGIKEIQVQTPKHVAY